MANRKNEFQDFGITPFSCLPSKIFLNKNGFFVRIFLQIFHNENNKLTVTHFLNTIFSTFESPVK